MFTLLLYRLEDGEEEENNFDTQCTFKKVGQRIQGNKVSSSNSLVRGEVRYPLQFSTILEYFREPRQIWPVKFNSGEDAVKNKKK